MTRRDLAPVYAAAAALTTPQIGRAYVRLGRNTRMSLHVEVTPAGLLAIGALVSGILLSTAGIVRAARRPR